MTTPRSYAVGVLQKSSSSITNINAVRESRTLCQSQNFMTVDKPTNPQVLTIPQLSSPGSSCGFSNSMTDGDASTCGPWRILIKMADGFSHLRGES
jgi:hypothetical protein